MKVTGFVTGTASARGVKKPEGSQKVRKRVSLFYYKLFRKGLSAFDPQRNIPWSGLGSESKANFEQPLNLVDRCSKLLLCRSWKDGSVSLDWGSENRVSENEMWRMSQEAGAWFLLIKIYFWRILIRRDFNNLLSKRRNQNFGPSDQNLCWGDHNLSRGNWNLGHSD